MTKLAHKRLQVTGMALLAVLTIACGVWLSKGDDSVQFGSKIMHLERATTSAEREKGLSGRTSLPANQGMLFVFNHPDQYCFWMKDMHLNIDIIWLDKAQKVIKIQEKASPLSYPAAFCPDRDAQYVIEVPGGVTREAGVQIGQHIPLD